MNNPNSQNQDDNLINFFYKGQSMAPTLKPGFVVYVKPKVQNIESGDVIVIKKNNRLVVHRVKSINKHGVITRGDNNLTDDSPVSFDQILGRAEMVDNGKVIRKLSKGKWGSFLANLSWFLLYLMRVIKSMLREPYRMMKNCGIVLRLWHPKIQRIRIINEDNIEIIKYIHGKRTVAIWEPSINRFEYKHPYELVIKKPDSSP